MVLASRRPRRLKTPKPTSCHKLRPKELRPVWLSREPRQKYRSLRRRWSRYLRSREARKATVKD